MVTGVKGLVVEPGSGADHVPRGNAATLQEVDHIILGQPICGVW